MRTFLLEHPNVHLHFTPTYSSWLNQVELWFSKIERDLLARGIFTSVADLARKIRRYIHRYNKAPKPIRWAYRNPAHRIGSSCGPVEDRSTLLYLRFRLWNLFWRRMWLR